ncbi:hypothetical protein, partial [Deinococcus rubellus]|uniref:hypothetical protein n=1 Tax=Deinococcus rubellus TaxID=1889240 RepID=UPI0031EC95F0
DSTICSLVSVGHFFRCFPIISLQCALPSQVGGRFWKDFLEHYQETFSVYEAKSGLTVSVQMTISTLIEHLGSDWQDRLEESGYEVTEHRYKPGGHDQADVWALGKDDAITLVAAGTTSQAMALLNLRLMRRGACPQPGSHNPQLVDAAMEALELALPSLNLDHS